MKITNILQLISISLIVLFWPLNFILNNDGQSFFQYFFLTPFLMLSYYLFTKKSKLWIFLLIGIVVIYGYLSFENNFRENSIFYPNRDDEQRIIREGYLYPTIWMSRLFQNKPTIYWNRIKANSFALTDPNNYFFGFHPMEIKVENQNLQKFPSLAIIFLLTGLYYLPKSNNKLFLIFSILSFLFLLGFKKNFDKEDLILLFPISLLIINGLREIKKHLQKYYSLVLIGFIIYSVIEYCQIIINGVK